MSKQRSFSEIEYSQKKRLTRREELLNEMETTLPWSRLLTVIESYYPKSGLPGRQPVGLSKMFRIHCMQNWFKEALNKS